MRSNSTLKIATSILAAWIFLSATCSVRSAAPPESFTLVEAESISHGVVKDDPSAFGGAYVEQMGAYQPMVFAPLPTAGDSWVIWIRVKDVNLQLKGVGADGSQKELNWDWSQSDDWAWINMGRHSREELGAQAMLMRGPNAGEHPGLDAIVFASDDSFNPATDLKPPSMSLVPVSITLDWKSTIATATPLSYGLNAFAGFDPTVTQNSQYESNMTSMHSGFLRLHNWGIMNDSKQDASGWIDNAKQCWDSVKIKSALTGAYGYKPALMINIPAWPNWMDKDHDDRLDSDQTDAYAAFCAQLVKIVNKDISHHVTYWEVTNERDGPYYGDYHENGGKLKDATKPDHLDELAAIYNRCAVAMKAVDPTIKVGGPAVARPDWIDFVTRFVSETAPHLDFFSYHAYASGSKDDTDRQIYDRTDAFGSATKQIVSILKSASPNRTIESIFDEYNISWTWETRDPRMKNVKGAVFDALSITSAITNGVTATAAWNERDGIYGKMDEAYQMHSSATLFQWLNENMIGSVVSATSSDPLSVRSYAVASTDGRKALLLINRSSHDRMGFAPNWPDVPTVQYQLTDAGVSTHRGAGAQLAMPANSVTLLVTLPPK